MNLANYKSHENLVNRLRKLTKDPEVHEALLASSGKTWIEVIELIKEPSLKEWLRVEVSLIELFNDNKYYRNLRDLISDVQFAATNCLVYLWICVLNAPSEEVKKNFLTRIKYIDSEFNHAMDFIEAENGPDFIAKNKEALTNPTKENIVRVLMSTDCREAKQECFGMSIEDDCEDECEEDDSNE